MAGDDLASLLRGTASNLGIDPSDLGTAMSYETGGTMNPNLMGGKGGQYMGLIQFSPENQEKYGVYSGMPLSDHMDAVEAYLRDRGVKPGMGLLDIYSTINAGRPGLYNASDAANGGAPGTVADKVAGMVGHRANANAILRSAGDPSTATSAQPQGSGAPLPIAPAPTPADAAAPAAPPQQQASGFDPAKFNDALVRIQNQRKQQQDQWQKPAPINVAMPQNNPAARMLQAALSRGNA